MNDKTEEPRVRKTRAWRKAKEAAERDARIKELANKPIEFMPIEAIRALPLLGGIIDDEIFVNSETYPLEVQLPVSERLAKLFWDRNRPEPPFVAVEYEGRGVAVSLLEAEAHGLSEAPNWIPDLGDVSIVPSRGEIARFLAPGGEIDMSQHNSRYNEISLIDGWRDGELVTYLYSPFHPSLPPLLKKAGGHWDAMKRAWWFDDRDAGLVAEICLDVFGTTGRDKPELVTLRLTAPDDVHELQGGIFLAGRCLARATGRDSGAKLGPGVKVLDGGVRSGGSMKNWLTIIEGGTTLEVFDIPKPAVDRISDHDRELFEIEVIEPKKDNPALHYSIFINEAKFTADEATIDRVTNALLAAGFVYDAQLEGYYSEDRAVRESADQGEV